MPYGQAYGIDQCATVTILMQHFHKFFGKFITGPYWNAYPMTFKSWDYLNPLLGCFGFCNPRLSWDYLIIVIFLNFGLTRKSLTKIYLYFCFSII